MTEADDTAPILDRHAFGHWLSGFVDGEGCFELALRQESRRGIGATRQPVAQFAIGLRQDDTAILQTIKSFWGCGGLSLMNKKGVSLGIQFRVSAVAHLAEVLVPHFDHYPLRAKKAADFLLWKEGVLLCAKVTNRPRRKAQRGQGGKWSAQERQQFADLAACLKEGRRYVNAGVPILLPARLPPPGLFDRLK